MPLRQLKGKYRRKMGEQYFVVNCPDCNRRHWIKAGPYTADPTLALGVRELPCGYTATIIPDQPLVVDKTKGQWPEFRTVWNIKNALRKGLDVYAKIKDLPEPVRIMDAKIADHYLSVRASYMGNWQWFQCLFVNVFTK